MIDIRRTSLHLTCLAILACGPETVPADEAGSTTDPGDTGTDTDPSDTGTGTETGTETVCGDGSVDLGEACDDANLADDDGCTTSCEIGPCGFEWVLREPAVTVDSFAGFDLVDGALEATTAEWGLGPVLSQVTRIAGSDGAIESTTDVSDVIGDEVLVSLVRGSSGERFAVTDAAMSSDFRVLRLSSTLEVLWDVVVPNSGNFADLASNAGQVAIVANVDVTDTDRDATVISLDPDDGNVLWSYNLGGQVADNGYSLDVGTTLTIDSDGRVFVGFVEYIAWDTTAATVAAFAPAGGEPLWITRAVELQGERVGAQDLAVGPDGTVYLTAQSWDDYFESYLVTLAPETGSIEWIFDYDDLPIDRTWATALGVAASADRVLTTGYWSYFEGDDQVVQAYAAGFDLGGALVCIGTYDTYPQPNADDDVSWLPYETVAGSQGEFYLGGIVYPWFGDSNELFAARIR